MAKRHMVGTTAPQHCAHCPIRVGNPCSAIAADRLDELNVYRSGYRLIRAGHVLFEPGDEVGHVYSVIDGWLFLYQILADGRRQILDFALPGALVGLVADDGESIYGVQALSEALLCVVPRARVLALARRFPAYGEQLIRAEIREQTLTFERLTCLGRRCAQERVAHLLLELFCRLHHRLPAQAGETTPLPLTQGEIADAVGLTPVHVNRTLQELRRLGILEVGKGQLRIVDSERLAELAGFPEAILPLLSVRSPAATINGAAPAAPASTPADHSLQATLLA